MSTVVPGKVDAVSAEASSDVGVELSWQEPEDARGVITSYEVKVKPGLSNDLVTEDTGILLEGLSACTEYEFTIKAANSEGYGEESDPVSERTLSPGQ